MLMNMSAASAMVRAIGPTCDKVGEAGEAARDADRPAAVGAECERRDAGGDRGRGAGARAARGLCRIPRIARDAGERAIADRLAAELAGGGLADQDRARLLHAFDR